MPSKRLKLGQLLEAAVITCEALPNAMPKALHAMNCPLVVLLSVRAEVLTSSLEREGPSVRGKPKHRFQVTGQALISKQPFVVYATVLKQTDADYFANSTFDGGIAQLSG